MKAKIKRTTLMVNSALIGIFALVFSVCYFSTSVIPISTAGSFSAIYCGDTSKSNVSLMFNVYENAETVNNIIDVLEKYNVKATFFVGGCWADDNEATLKRIVKSGHEIANHGYFHKDHKTLSYDKNRQEISSADTVIYSLCGVKPTLFAPPSGSYGKDTVLACEKLDYKLIMWSKDTIDWRDSDTDKIFTRATKNLKNGDLVLMHPKIHTLSVLPRILEYYQSNGFSVVTVSQNIGDF